MKKLLVVFDGMQYSSSLSQFAIQLAKQSGSLLHALFILPTVAPSTQLPVSGELPLPSGELIFNQDLRNDEREVVEANLQVFKDSCLEAKVSCHINDDLDITIEELIDHSAFSDLLLCDAGGELGGISINQLLTDTHCPVLLVPGKAALPKRTVFCYDESFSSIHALKMFSYLFPEWKEHPSVLVSINPKGDNGSAYDDYLADWLPQHFSNVQQHSPEGNLQKELVTVIRKVDDPSVVVMGAFGKNATSLHFQKSLANVIIEETAACLFIMNE